MRPIRRKNRRNVPFRESDSYDEGFQAGTQETDGSFSNSQSLSRFGERRIHDDRYEEDEYANDHDPSYLEEYDMKVNHFGKGPKGYQRSPARIKDEACEILARDFELDASGITIDLENRVLILKGEVNSRRDKRRAEWLLEELPGIEDIRNLISIKKSNIEGWIPGLGSIEDEV